MPAPSSTFPTPDNWSPHRISYGETDAMGVVYYANYMNLFERGRSEFIRAFGMSYRDVEAKGVFLPVREAHCRYRKSLVYDDLVMIRTGISEWGRASMTFTYEICNEDRSQVHATGYTQHASLNTDGRPAAVPDWLKDLFTVT